MAPSKEYFIGDERFTPSSFRRLSRARKIEAMVQWFHSNYQDPVHETSYNGREGGFLWNHGGPYDADDELQTEFSDLADFEIIQDAVSEVTRDGTYEWAPVRSDYDDIDQDYDRDIRLQEGESDGESNANSFPELPAGEAYLTTDDGLILTDEDGRGLVADVSESLGAIGAAPLGDFALNGPAYAGEALAGASFATRRPSPNDDVRDSIEALRTEMLSRLDGLEAVVRHSLSVAPNRGHNNPPELLDVERPVTQEQFQEVIAAIEELRQESASPAPNVANVEANASIFRRIAKTLAITVLGVGAFVAQEIASIEIGLAHTQHRQAVIDALFQAADSATVWVQSLPSPF